MYIYKQLCENGWRAAGTKNNQVVGDVSNDQTEYKQFPNFHTTDEYEITTVNILAKPLLNISSTTPLTGHHYSTSYYTTPCIDMIV
jgi:hypothetical protein